ncbi:MAG: hypothetical protein JXA42_21435, partial [Anaerolineales bacterium]|nr:hypothetical protein [Anaerolineales bacterium]
MKRWFLFSILLIVSLIIVACGPTAEPTATPKPAEPVLEPTEETTMEETAAEEAVTVRLLSGAVGQELELTQAAAQRYMDAHPNVTIEVFDTPDAVQDRLGVYLQYFETQSSEADIYQIDVIW